MFLDTVETIKDGAGFSLFGGGGCPCHGIYGRSGCVDGVHGKGTFGKQYGGCYR